MNKAITESPGSSKHPAVLFALALLLPAAFSQSPSQPAQDPSAKLYTQRGKIKSLTPQTIVLEAVDVPPTTFVLTSTTDNGPLQLGELVQVTFTLAGDLKLARVIAEIKATPVNLPRAVASTTPSSAAVDLPKDGSRQNSSSASAVSLPSGTGPNTPAPIVAAPISLAADESQLSLLHAPEIHQSGVIDPLRLAILDLQPAPAPDLTSEIATTLSDRLADLLHNDVLFTLLDRSKLPAAPTTDLTDPAAIIAFAKTLDHPDVILLGAIEEEIPDQTSPDGQHRHKIQAVYPTILLEGRLYDAHTGHLLGTPKGRGGGSQDRADDRTSPMLRAIRDAVEALAAAIDPDYPSLLDPRTFATVVSVDPNRITVAFPGIPSVQMGNHLQVTHPTWFTRDPATGNVVAVPTDPIGIFTVTSLEKSEASGTYQGTAPIPGQTIRLSR